VRRYLKSLFTLTDDERYLLRSVRADLAVAWGIIRMIWRAVR
jgi:hypothetical protein